MELRKALEPGDKFLVLWEPNTEDSPSDMSDYDGHWLEVSRVINNHHCSNKGQKRCYRGIWNKDNNPGKMNPGTMGDNSSTPRFVWYEWNITAVRYKNEPFPPETTIITKEMLPYI